MEQHKASLCSARGSSRQDDIEARRDALIAQLEAQLQQQVEERTLFTVEWELA